MLRTVRPNEYAPSIQNTARPQEQRSHQTQQTQRSSSRTGKMDVPTELIECFYDQATGVEQTRTWIRGKFLGKGGFAEVYDITNAETGEHFAGKVIAKSSLQKKKAKDKLRMEIRVHRSLVHKNIVKFVSYFEVQDFYIIVLELCPNRSMMELLKSRKRLTEPEARYYLAQMVSALQYMHKQRIIHRDLKLGNIFLNANLEIKIGDFGLATQLSFDDERKKTICGTPNYIAPEVLHGGEVGHSYQVDIWSLGVVLYTWIIGKPPFETTDVKTTYRRIRDSIYYFPDRVKVSDEAKDLIKRMLQKNPDERPTLDEILGHGFFACHLTPQALPSTALVMEPKLPDLTKRIFSAPAVMRNQDNENMNQNMLTVPSMAAAYVPMHKSPRGGNRQKKSPLANRDFNLKMEQNHLMPQKKRENIVDLIHKTLVQALEDQAQHITSEPPARAAPAPAVWIHRWGDYSSKYGLAYQYNTGSFGAYFNDASIMVLTPSGERAEYFERQKSKEIKESFNVDNYPVELKKKVNLLQYFTNYLPQKSSPVGHVDNQQAAADNVRHQNLVYVRKWLKTRHAIFFRLTDNTLQVNFTDSTGLILSEKGNVVTFIDKKNRMMTLWTSQVSAHENGSSISSRLHYIKDMLACLINKRTPE